MHFPEMQVILNWYTSQGTMAFLVPGYPTLVSTIKLEDR